MDCLTRTTEIYVFRVRNVPRHTCSVEQSELCPGSNLEDEKNAGSDNNCGQDVIPVCGSFVSFGILDFLPDLEKPLRRDMQKARRFSVFVRHADRQLFRSGNVAKSLNENGDTCPEFSNSQRVSSRATAARTRRSIMSCAHFAGVEPGLNSIDFGFRKLDLKSSSIVSGIGSGFSNTPRSGRITRK